MNASLSKKNLRLLEQRLLTLHESMLGDLEELEEDAVGSAARPIERQGDGGVIESAQETGLGLLEQDEALLSEVVDALARLREGEYGRCERCDSGITLERLQVMPHARRCLSCEAKRERELVRPE